MPFAGYAILVIGLLCATNWIQWQRGSALGSRLEQADADLIATRETAERASAAFDRLQTETTRLRGNYETASRSLAKLSDDGCIRRDHPPAVGELLRAAGTLDATPDRPPPPDSGLRRKDLPGRHPVHP